MKKIIIADSNDQHRRKYQSLILQLSMEADVIAWTTSYIDTKEKLLEYVPDFLFMDHFNEDSAASILSLVKEQQLPIVCYIVSEQITYAQVRLAFLQGVHDYIDYNALDFSTMKGLIDIKLLSTKEENNFLINDQIQQYLGLLKDKQEINIDTLSSLFKQTTTDFTTEKQLIYFRIDRIHKVYAQGIENRLSFRNQLYRILESLFTTDHSIYFSKNHSGILIIDFFQLGDYDFLLQNIMNEIYQQFHYTITFTISNTFLGFDAFLTAYETMIDAQDAKFYLLPGRIIKMLPIFHKLQTINVAYQRKRFSTIRDLSKENMYSFLDSTTAFFRTNNIEPNEVRNFYKYTLSKVNVIAQEHGMDQAFPFENYSLQISISEYQDDLIALLQECFDNILIWIHSSALKYSKMIEEVIAVIDAHPEYHFTLEGLAKRFMVSSVHLSRTFKKETAITLFDYINKKKMEKACSLLNTTQLRIQDIAMELGFKNQFYFSKIFQRYYQTSPSKYRNRDKIDN